MPDPQKNPQPPKDRVWFTSDCDIIEIREEDTTPAPPSASLRKWMEQKYGKKAPPPGPASDEPK